MREIALMKRKEYPAVATATPDRTYEFVISTETPDRDRDVIRAAGWKLDHYRKNPVVLYAHDYRSLPIGRAERVRIVGTTLRAVAVPPPPGLLPFADQVWGLVRSGALKAASVGFKPLTYTYNAERGGHDIDSAELLEFSVVPVPANAEALLQGCIGADCDPAAKSAMNRWLKSAGCRCSKTDDTFYFDDEDIPVEDEDQYIAQSPAEIMGFVDQALRSLDWRALIGKAVRNEILYHQGSVEYDPHLFTRRGR